jgi:hypothetical protein
MVRPSHVAVPDLPGEAGSAGATRELSPSPGCAEAPGLMVLGGGSGGHGPSCQARRPYATWPRGEGEYGLWESEGLDTLAGGTPIRMYRHMGIRPVGVLEPPSPPIDPPMTDRYSTLSIFLKNSNYSSQV